MSKVDQFESVFKRAAKSPYEHQPLAVASVAIVSDLEGDAAEGFETRVRAYLCSLMEDACREEDEGEIAWVHITREDFQDVDDLLGRLETEAPQLICTYRSLGSEAWRWSTTLGRYVDILAQETEVPVLLLPHPRAEQEAPELFPHGPPRYGKTGTQVVMALTDHIEGEHRLIHWAVRCTREGGTLVLAHVEDGRVFDRYMAAIERIPELDTDETRELMRAQLLKGPHDYIVSVAGTLRTAREDAQVVEVVTMGHRLQEYRGLIDTHKVDLLVMHTKDDEQLAMHGLAYPLVVEMRDIPILML